VRVDDFRYEIHRKVPDLYKPVYVCQRKPIKIQNVAPSVLFLLSFLSASLLCSPPRLKFCAFPFPFHSEQSPGCKCRRFRRELSPSTTKKKNIDPGPCGFSRSFFGTNLPGVAGACYLAPIFHRLRLKIKTKPTSEGLRSCNDTPRHIASYPRKKKSTPVLFGSLASVGLSPSLSFFSHSIDSGSKKKSGRPLLFFSGRRVSVTILLTLYLGGIFSTGANL